MTTESSIGSPILVPVPGQRLDGDAPGRLVWNLDAALASAASVIDLIGIAATSTSGETPQGSALTIAECAELASSIILSARETINDPNGGINALLASAAGAMKTP